MKTLGLDLGEKRIGVAVSDESGRIALPTATISGDRPACEIVADILDLADQHGAQRIVIGMPTSLSGEAGPAAQKAAQFARALAAETSLQVITWDERLTTALAEKAMISANVRRRQRRQKIDKVAATLILQNYLDAHANEQTN